jgi:NitT/TauT family transport system substrate-binding protein
LVFEIGIAVPGQAVNLLPEGLNALKPASIYFGCAAAFTIWFVHSALASEQGSQRILVGYSSPSGSQAVVWLAKDAGSFQRHGLDVELIFIPAGSKMTQALLAGDIKIAQVGGIAPIAARLRGAELKIVAVSYNTLALSLMSQKEIRSLTELKGKRIGITRFGSNSDFALRYVLKKNGILERDVFILQFGDPPSTFAALQAGSIQAGIMSYPTTAAAIKKGYNELVEMSEIGLEYPGTNVAVTDRLLQTQRDIVRRFLMGYVEGIQRFKTDEIFTKRVISKYLRVSDPVILDETYKLFAPQMAKIPYPTPAAIRLALESVSDDPRARTAKPEDFYDDSILRSLEKEGFIQQLYR